LWKTSVELGRSPKKLQAMPKNEFIPDLPEPAWVISDTHLGHANILQYCPWRQTWAADVDSHDREIISAWQATVANEDWVLHLGDFALTDRAGLAEYRAKLSGRICLVLGNHDRSRSAMLEAGFDMVVRRGQSSIGGRLFFCRHDPNKVVAEEADRADYILHGHCHGNARQGIESGLNHRMIDCSLDALRSVGPLSLNNVCASG
jgi:calcineurin-like phosphoesterase family protein